MKELSFAQSIANRHLQRDQERLLATLLNQLDGMVYRCRDDAHWTMEFVSVGCFTLTGYRPEELLLNYRVSYEEVTHPDDRERVRESIHAAIAERRRFDLEYRIVRADGAVRWVWERGVGIFREDGSLEAIQGVIDDVTPRKENERIVRDAELRYRSIVENAVEGFFQTTLEGAYLNVNPALVQIYGYDSADELKQAFSDIGRQLYVDPNRRAEFMREIRRHGVVNNFESQVFRKNGEVIWITENAREVRDATGNPAYYEGTVENITERKSYETRLSHQATHDGLTGLPNRLLFADRLQQAMPLAEREGMRLAVVFVDLDNFKYINDSLGHEAGDDLIRVMARRLQACTRDSDTVARLGGDEFVLLLQGQHVATAAISIAMSRILTIVGAPVRIQDREFTLTCSVGVSVYPDDGKDVDTLLKHADAAMYQAKQVGRNNFQFFTPMLNQRVIDRMDIEHRLRHAVERDEFLLHYQPRFDLRSRSVVGAEALIRWKAPQGLVSPARFIPVAEETGLIEPIGEWVLHTACLQARAWCERGAGKFQVSVNVSPRQFGNRRLPEIVDSILRRTGVEPETIELEITESCLVNEPERFIVTLNALKELGVHLAIDDFGVGYSSMAYLKAFPVDRLKVDRTFVEGLATSEKDRSILRAIVSLGHNLGMRVLAEGVETAEQHYFLREVGCDEVQGYFFGMPLPASEIEIPFKTPG
jgi:diguanylate cyclase (GGDEF)-like protein/PAS domain S-box-containing protein